MLEKDKGDPKINHLRIICLYKADYNIFLKILWAHRLVKISKSTNFFDDAQAGGRPNRTSGDVAVRKMLTYAYSCVTRTPFACMDLDAKLCYNRIIASFRMLDSRYFGMPKDACILHSKTIAEMKHNVKTALGISLAFFQSTPERLLNGSGQGSSRSPPLWMTISIILFCTLEAQMGIGATYTCPRQHLTTNHTTEVFVNNSTNFINNPHTVYSQPTQQQALTTKRGMGTHSECIRGQTQITKIPCLHCGVRLEQGQANTVLKISNINSAKSPQYRNSTANQHIDQRPSRKP
jgi:hypothetical protein